MNLSRFTIIIYIILGMLSLTLSYTLDRPNQYFGSLFLGIFGNVMEFMVIVEVLKYINRKN